MIAYMTIRTVATACLAAAAFGAVWAGESGLVWRHGADLPTPVGGHCVASVGTRLLCAGGTTWQDGQKRWLRDVSAYDVAGDRWEAVSPLPEPIGDAVGIGTGRALCLIGGGDGQHASDRCTRLRVHGGRLTVESLPALPAPRVYAAGGRTGHTLYVVGGTPDPGKLDQATATLFALDLQDLQSGWRTLAPLPGPARVIHAAAACGGRLYVFGGCRLDDRKVVRNLSDAYCYSPRADRWERLPDAPAANRAWTAVADGRGGLLLCGGFTATEEQCAGQGDDFGFTAEVLRYDPAARTYSPVGRLPRATACAAPVRQGRELLLLGGEPVKKQRGNWVWITSLTGLPSRQ